MYLFGSRYSVLWHGPLLACRWPVSPRTALPRRRCAVQRVQTRAGCTEFYVVLICGRDGAAGVLCRYARWPPTGSGLNLASVQVPRERCGSVAIGDGSIYGSVSVVLAPVYSCCRRKAGCGLCTSGPPAIGPCARMAQRPNCRCMLGGPYGVGHCFRVGHLAWAICIVRDQCL